MLSTRVRWQVLADGDIQVDVYIYANESDADSANVASIGYVKHDPQQSVEDFLADRTEDIANRLAAYSALPPPGPPGSAHPSPFDRLVSTLVGRDIIQIGDVYPPEQVAPPSESDGPEVVNL